MKKIYIKIKHYKNLLSTYYQKIKYRPERQKYGKVYRERGSHARGV